MDGAHLLPDAFNVINAIHANDKFRGFVLASEAACRDGCDGARSTWEMHRETSQLKRKVLGEEHPETLTSMNNLAGALSSQGEYEEAEEMHRKTLQLSRKVLGDDHPSMMVSVHNLAYVLALRSRFVQATILYERAVAGYQRLLGPDHPATRSCMEQYSLFRNSRVNEN
ncbi:hypothetical protein LTR41_011588 [Exophiala xenobiotica]|nr:hypothetical protein LTR41_011588 [Exophiala xenobiotica]KAK5550728.1 hypothetical protein LTR46_011266 [Exophiala xenobiotica]